MVTPRVLILAVVTVVPACLHGPRTHAVDTTDPRGDAIDAVLRTLVRHGLQPSAVDRNSGTIVTRWRDTGHRFRETDASRPVGYYSDVFLRHRISLTGSGDSLKVTLRTEVQRCAPLDAVITGDGVLGTCQSLHDITSEQQVQVRELAEQLDRAITRPRA